MSKPLLTLKSSPSVKKIEQQLSSKIEPQRKPISALASSSRKPIRDRKIRSTSFNLGDPLELQMSAHADRYSCFSSYIKRLIHQDMLSGITTATTTPPQVQCHDVKTSRVGTAAKGLK